MCFGLVRTLAMRRSLLTGWPRGGWPWPCRPVRLSKRCHAFRFPSCSLLAQPGPPIAALTKQFDLRCRCQPWIERSPKPFYRLRAVSPSGPPLHWSAQRSPVSTCRLACWHSWRVQIPWVEASRPLTRVNIFDLLTMGLTRSSCLDKCVMVESFSRNPAKPKTGKGCQDKKAASSLNAEFLRASLLTAMSNYMRTPIRSAHTFPGKCCEILAIRKSSAGGFDASQEIESSNAETEVKGSVRLPTGYNDGVPQEGQKTFVRGWMPSASGPAACVFGRFQG